MAESAAPTRHDIHDACRLRLRTQGGAVVIIAHTGPVDEERSSGLRRARRLLHHDKARSYVKPTSLFGYFWLDRV
jgi:hypothetical protein